MVNSEAGGVRLSSLRHATRCDFCSRHISEIEFLYQGGAGAIPVAICNGCVDSLYYGLHGSAPEQHKPTLVIPKRQPIAAPDAAIAVPVPPESVDAAG